MNTNKTVRVRIPGATFPLLGLLAIVFITLKLVGVITWPWWLVLLPLYFPAVLVAGIILVAIPLALAATR